MDFSYELPGEHLKVVVGIFYYVGLYNVSLLTTSQVYKETT